MQRLREIPQEVYDFLRNFRLRAGDLNRKGGSKTAPFTHPLPGVPTPLAGISILQQTLSVCYQMTRRFRSPSAKLTASASLIASGSRKGSTHMVSAVLQPVPPLTNTNHAVPKP